MAFVVTTGGVYLAKFYCQMGRQTSINTLGYECLSSVGAGASDVDMAATLSPLFGAKFKLLMAPQATYYGVTVQRVDPGNISIITSGNVATGLGTLGAVSAPKQICGLIRKLTEMAGRHGHGRWYQPFPNQESITGAGAMTGAYLAALVNMETTVKTPVTVVGAGGTATITPSIVVLPRRAKPGPPPIPAVPFSVVNMSNARAQGLWATQRRRGDYGRENGAPF